MGSCGTWFSLLNHLCQGSHAVGCHAEALMSLTSQPRVNIRTLCKIHTHAHTLPFKGKQSTYLTVVLSELVHLKSRERERETETRLRHTHTGRAAKQADAAANTMTRLLVHTRMFTRANECTHKTHTDPCEGSQQQMQWMITGAMNDCRNEPLFVSEVFVVAYLLSLGSTLLKVTLFTG